MGIGAYSSSNINLAVSGTSYVMLDLKKWTLFVLVLENTMAKFLRSNQVKLSFKTFFKKNLENSIGNTLTGFPIKLKAFGLKNYYHRLHQKFLYSKIRSFFESLHSNFEYPFNSQYYDFSLSECLSYNSFAKKDFLNGKWNNYSLHRDRTLLVGGPGFTKTEL